MDLPRQKQWLLLLAVLLIGSLPYWQSLSFGYALDDDFFLENAYVQEGLGAVPDIFSHGYFAGYNGKNDAQYRPIPLTVFALERQLGFSPGMSHALSLLLYLLCGWLIWRLLDDWLGDRLWLKAGILGLFLLHPVHVEAVCSLKNREEILMLLFLLASALALGRWFKSGSRGALALSMGLYALALLSKEHALSWVAIVPMMGWVFYDKKLKQTLLAALPFLGLALGYLLLRNGVMDSLVVDREISQVDNVVAAAEGFGGRLAGVSLVMGQYWRLLIWPLSLSWDYSYNALPLEGWGQLSVWLGALLNLGLLAWGLWALPKRKPIAFGILWVFVSLFLVSNLLVLIGTTLGERFLLLPSLGYCLALGLSMERLAVFLSREEGKQRQILLGFLAGIGLLYGLRTTLRAPVWKDKLSLFASGLESAPQSVKVHFALGSEYNLLWEEQQKPALLDSTLLHCNRALEILPEHPDSWYLSGMAYFRKGDQKNAFNAFAQATSLDSSLAQAWNYMGVIAMQVGDLPHSREYFEQAIAADAGYARPWVNLGVWWGRQGKEEEARRCFEKALALDPNNAEARKNLQSRP